MNDKETEVIAGTLEGVTKRKASWQLAIKLPGAQYAKNVFTRDQSIVTTAEGLIGQQVNATCHASHYTRDDGTPGRSLWVDSFNVGNGSAPVQQAIQAVRESKAAVANAPDPTRSSIEKQVALKAAVEHHKGEVDPTEVIQTAAHFFAFLQGDPSWLQKQIQALRDEVPF